MKAKKWIFFSALILFSFVIFISQKNEQTQEINGNVFGSYFIIRYYGEADKKKLSKDIDKFFNEFDNEFSTYRSDSVISQFNSLPPLSKLKVSSLFIKMLKLAHQFNRETNGIFDPTLGPVIRAWGFGSKINPTPPTPQELTKAMQKTGLQNVKWDERTSLIWKTKEGIELNINAFAPGWAADLITEVFKQHNISNYMIDISGEIIFKGTKPGDLKWIAGIERPLKEHSGVETAFYIKDLAISTSGTYRQFYKHNGKRRSHIIDPRTGYPVIHDITSATVIAPTAASADAWSTAMTILGADGIELSEQRKMKVFLLRQIGKDKFHAVSSTAMQEYIEDNKIE